MRKTVAILLTFLLFIGILSPAAAAATTGTCRCGFSPVIYVGPLGSADIVRDAGTDTEQTLWKIDSAFLLASGKEQLPTLLKAAATGSADTLGDALVAFALDCFGDLALDGNGNSKENVTTPSLNFPTSGKHGIDTDFYFNYDFRLDPCLHAERLHTCIEEVKRLTGHDQVQLFCSSMGGVVLSAYLAAYGTDDVETILCRCCPLQGTAVAGELFCGKLEINGNAVMNYARDAIPYLDGGDFLQGSLYALTGVFRTLGVWRILEGLGEAVTDKLAARIYREALIPVFATMPGIWSFVPAEYYDDALAFMGVSADTGEVFDKIEAYHAIQATAADRLRQAYADGVKTYIHCGYNVQRTPLVTAYKNTSDGTVDTKYASLGATCGEYKQPLPNEYLTALTDTTYLSADKMLDASTCALPDCTWFFRDWLHCNGNDALSAFVKRLLLSETQLTVFSMEEYPQFMQNDDAGVLTPVTGAPDALARFRETRSYLNFFRLLADMITRLLEKFGAA